MVHDDGHAVISVLYVLCHSIWLTDSKITSESVIQYSLPDRWRSHLACRRNMVRSRRVGRVSRFSSSWRPDSEKDTRDCTMTHSGLGAGCSSASCWVATSRTRQWHTVDSVLDVLQCPVRWWHPTHGNYTQWTRCSMFFSVLFGGDIPHTAITHSGLGARCSSASCSVATFCTR